MKNSQIQVLPEDLINKIAAGEVIERPSSVVKELVENSIDAYASHIEIEIQDAGKKLIRVTDDGVGMTSEEIELALKRHSTSKIKTLDDLFNIKTLGFRGEALPSIDSVSKFQMEPNSNGKGITSSVKELFYNTPVRLKFLKSNTTEINHIEDLVSNFILSSPKISFKLIVDGKIVLTSQGNGKLTDAIYSVFGLELSRELLEVKGESVYGFVSKPNISRLDRSFEVFFVNGRSVKNFMLGRATEEAYRNLIPGNRYPVAILFVDIPPQEVDVNVHPAKREVKFLKTKEVMARVTFAVKESLEGVMEGDKFPISNVQSLEKLGTSFPISNGGQGEYKGSTDNLFQKIHIHENQWTPQMAEILLDQLPQVQVPTMVEESTFIVSSVQPLIPIYQFINTYIICTDGEDLVLLDQHATHERILFDKLQKSENLGMSSSQSLLISETLEFSHGEASVLEENFEEFKRLGFEIEHFGKDSFIVRMIPSILMKASPKEVITDIITELKSGEFKNQPEKKKDKLNKMIACKAAIKAGDKLSQTEIQNLIRDLYKTENPLTCPHGRPTIVKITKYDLEKMFGRK
ncbi:hypothetical protein A3J90_03560 [candidate division WOR-1 bacterium RIFOXYC2_FULL_37_10]|nr:MAG: hypothetical protein A3J90_03560 [candidate division WOR-1 bacterium RIFOXYC2_FULL_37_10]